MAPLTVLKIGGVASLTVLGGRGRGLAAALTGGRKQLDV